MLERENFSDSNIKPDSQAIYALIRVIKVAATGPIIPVVKS